MAIHTIVVDFADGDGPAYHHGVQIFGGTVNAVQFSDALAELERVTEQRDELLASLYEANKKNDGLNHVKGQSMRAHTPGPWFCGRALRGGQECIIGDGDSVVAFMPDRTIGCSFIREDAMLISAAPKLLDAAKELLSSESPNMTHRNAKEREAYKMIRAAVAAATGDKA